MLIAVLFIVCGIGLMAWNPSWGLVPAFLFLVLGVMIGIVALFGRRTIAFADIAATKACPECRSRIPPAALSCSRCGYRYANDAA